LIPNAQRELANLVASNQPPGLPAPQKQTGIPLIARKGKATYKANRCSDSSARRTVVTSPNRYVQKSERAIKARHRALYAEVKPMPWTIR